MIHQLVKWLMQISFCTIPWFPFHNANSLLICRLQDLTYMWSIWAYYSNLHLEIISCTIKEVATSVYAEQLQLTLLGSRSWLTAIWAKNTNIQWKHLIGTVFPEVASLTYWQLSPLHLSSIAFKLGTVHWLTADEEGQVVAMTRKKFQLQLLDIGCLFP